MSHCGDTFAAIKAKGQMRRGTYLFPPVAALEFVNACRSSGVRLLGFDGFRLLGDEWIQPMLENSLDLSNQSHAGLTEVAKYDLAEGFLLARSHLDIVFEMVTDPDVL